MATFFRKYTQNSNYSFYRLVEISNSTDLLLVGRKDNRGYIGKVDAGGNLIWENEYHLGNQVHSLLQGWELPNGDFLVQGLIFTSNSKRRNYWLLRIDKQGKVIFSHQLNSTYSRTSSRFIPLPDGHFLITGWHTPSGDKIECIKIDENAKILDAWVFSFGNDDQLNDVAVVGDRLLYGGYSHHTTGNVSGIDAFLMHTDQQLQDPNAFWISYGTGALEIEQVNAIAPIGNDQFVMAVNFSTTFYVAMGQIKPGGKIEVGKPIRANIPWNPGIRKIIPVGQFVYVLGWDKGSLLQFVMKFEIKQTEGSRIWIKTFEASETYYLTDLVQKDDAYYLCGLFRDKNIDKPLLIRTDLDFESCATKELTTKSSYFFSDAQLNATNVHKGQIPISNTSVAAQVVSTRSNIDQLCPTGGFVPTDNMILQSPYIYLQSAGSLGNDSSKGIHNRWFFRNKLSELHLPKGNYAGNTDGLNKPEDFVKIYRAPYAPYFAAIPFADPPEVINETDHLWVYRSKSLSEHLFYLRFLDIAKYYQARLLHNPENNPQAFIQAYASKQGLLELELKDALCFGLEMYPEVANPGFECRLETFSVEGNTDLPESTISNRLQFSYSGTMQIRARGENINRIRFRTYNGTIGLVRVECYIDFLQDAVDQNKWEELGSYALTLDDAEAYLRLEDTAEFTVDNHWKNYNDNARVKVELFKARWTGVNPYTGTKEQTGLKDGVAKYISLSDDASNPKAEASLDADSSPSTLPDNINVSYLDLLNITATNFHAARMQGLGQVDADQPDDVATFVYLMEYYTLNSGLLDGKYGAQPVIQHVYMGLPTARQNERLPMGVSMLPVQYGLSLNGSAPAYPVTDDQGYTLDGQVRFINVFAKLSADYSRSDHFFNPNFLFSRAEFTHPVFIGMEYRKSGASWVEPELAHQQVFGQVENLPLVFFDDGSKPSLIHKETEEGIHEYWGYPINIFSRAGELGNAAITDYTRFTIPNTLLPPHNLRVQLIQPEGPLVLTSAQEQKLYESLGGDKTLLRVTFDYCHVHDINYAFGEKVQFVFRQPLQRIVKGGIDSVGGGDPVSVKTTTYKYTSYNGEEKPKVSAAVAGHFAGSNLVVNGEHFKVDKVTQSGQDPSFTVHKNQVAEVQTSGASSTVIQTLKGPETMPDNLFMLQENLKPVTNWDHELSYSVPIGDAWATKTETFKNEDGETVSRELRGIWATAVVKMVKGEVTPGVIGILVGQYEIEFTTYELPHHSKFQAVSNLSTGLDWHKGVDWYGGYVRVPLKSDPDKEWKALKVSQIENIAAGTLKLKAFDEAYDADEQVESFNPVIGGTPAPIEVNFYPGYRAYLEIDTPNGFDQSTILPAASEYEKDTLFGAYSLAPNPNSGGMDDYLSDVGTPQLVKAEAIIPARPPEEPLGPEYATPPDLYSKSTYTFEVSFQHTPYAIQVYRADLNAILYALYNRETIKDIKDKLPTPEADDFFTSRWKNVVRFDYVYDDPSRPFYDPSGDSSNGGFRAFPAKSGYAFPVPDKGINATYDDKFPYNGQPFKDKKEPEKVKTRMQAEIWNVFTPVLEEPLLFSSIGTQKITRAIPAVKLASNKIRFTDFGIDGEKITSYFYFAREIGSKNDISEPSPIAGPIQLINARPPTTPIVRKINSQLADSKLGQNTAVRLEVLGFPPYDKIRKVQLFRAAGVLDALNIRTMAPLGEIILDATQAEAETIEVMDEFTGSNEDIPYGEALHYRMVGYRKVVYKKEKNSPEIEAYVPSLPSKSFRVSLADPINPPPPVLTYKVGKDTGTELQQVELSWGRTAYNGTYRLLKMNRFGNWTQEFEVTTNDPDKLQFLLKDPLPKLDDGKPIYHRFKVTVENVSGLLNLTEKILTI